MALNTSITLFIKKEEPSEVMGFFYSPRYGLKPTCPQLLTLHHALGCHLFPTPHPVPMGPLIPLTY